MHVCTSDHDADPYGRGQSKLDWRTILTTHDRWLRTVVFWRLRDHQAVDDVMQEVALAAVRQASPISDVTRVAPWLYRLAVRAVLLHRRSQGRRRRMMERFGSLGANGKPCEPEPLDWLLSHERQAAVRKAMDRLPARDAEILLLKYTENWSYHQIAAHLGVGHSAVEARLHRARARLRSELGATDMVEVRS